MFFRGGLPGPEGGKRGGRQSGNSSHRMIASLSRGGKESSDCAELIDLMVCGRGEREQEKQESLCKGVRPGRKKAGEGETNSFTGAGQRQEQSEGGKEKMWRTFILG